MELKSIFKLIISVLYICLIHSSTLSDSSGFIFAKVLNETHFSCDNEKNILNLDRINDDSCDCDDGTDENRK